MPEINPGDVLLLDHRAGVQFAIQPAVIRVIKIAVGEEGTTWDGTIWLDAYELDQRGDAVERRQVYVRTAGVQHLRPGTQKGPGPASRETFTRSRPGASSF